MALIRIGTAGWAIPAPMRDGFAAAGSNLEKYATRLNAAEINTSFYRPHQRKTYERWAASTPDDFRFCVKLPRSITHEARLKDFAAPLQRFLEEISGLGEKLGVILVQLPPSLTFDAVAAGKLFAALSDHTIACEPRHASWFTRQADGLMREHHVARVAADPPRHADDGRPGGDTRLAYYRWHGSPRVYWSAYGDERLATLARAAHMSGAREVWCMFDNTTSGAALGDALRLAEMEPKQTAPLIKSPARRNPMARKYSKAAGKKVKKAVHEMHEGKLRSGGKNGPKVKSKKQAIAIGLSEARAEGKKVPKKKSTKKVARKKKSTTKKKKAKKSKKKS